MEVLSTQLLLTAWERAKSDRLPVERALSLLSAACPDETRSSLAALPIGKRDELLFGLREHSFGPEINAIADCPACKQRVQFQASVRDFIFAPRHDEENLLLESEGYQVEFRVPNSEDLMAAQRAGDPRRELLARLIVRLHRAGAPAELAGLPEDVMDKVESAMEIQRSPRRSPVHVAVPDLQP